MEKFSSTTNALSLPHSMFLRKRPNKSIFFRGENLAEKIFLYGKERRNKKISLLKEFLCKNFMRKVKENEKVAKKLYFQCDTIFMQVRER